MSKRDQESSAWRLLHEPPTEQELLDELSGPHGGDEYGNHIWIKRRQK